MLGYSGQKESPGPCPQEFAFHWEVERETAEILYDDRLRLRPKL